MGACESISAVEGTPMPPSQFRDHLLTDIYGHLPTRPRGRPVKVKTTTCFQPAELARRLQEIGRAIETLLATGVHTHQLCVEPTITFIGLPNVGKSSLMNRLCGVERAICEAVAGTTRDVLSAPVSLALIALSCSAS